MIWILVLEMLVCISDIKIRFLFNEGFGIKEKFDLIERIFYGNEIYGFFRV